MKELRNAEKLSIIRLAHKGEKINDIAERLSLSIEQVKEFVRPRKEKETFKSQCRKLSKYTIAEIEGLFTDMKYSKRFINKSNFVQLVLAQHIVDQFNKKYKIGDPVIWSFEAHGDSNMMFVKTHAFVHHAEPVVFFQNRTGYCSIAPEFIDQVPF